MNKSGHKSGDKLGQNLENNFLNKWIVTGALLGALVVGLGAFGAHGLKSVLSDYGHEVYQKAVLYHMFHVPAILLTGVLLRDSKKPLLNAAAMAFLLGIVLFSGSLYLLAITEIRQLGMVTPFGGLSFIAGWFMLATSFLRK